jgi:hypothetical protein
MAFSTRQIARLTKNLKKSVKILILSGLNMTLLIDYIFLILKLLLPARSANTRHSYEELLNSVPETRVTTLSNGLRVATEDYGLPTCTVI